MAPGPPAGQGISQSGKTETVSGGTPPDFGPFDAELGVNFVGRCAPEDWQFTGSTWQCTAKTSAVANVFLLNPTYLVATSQEFYTGSTGSLRSLVPGDLLKSDKSTAVPPPKQVPLLPIFQVSGAAVSSPGRSNDSQGKVNLPTVSQGELVRSKSLSIIGKILRPSDFINKPRQVIGTIYINKTSNSFTNAVNSFFQDLLNNLF